MPLRLDLLLQIEEAIQAIEQLADQGDLRAVTVQTAAPHANLPGYDLDELKLLQDEEIIAWALEGQRVLRRLELLSVPTIAVIREDWLGGAAELATACSYRIAADTASSRIGFHQTSLGFIPAWGGTVRLPRLVGLSRALDLILRAPVLQADQAKQVMLVDEVISVDRFHEDVARFAESVADRGSDGGGRRGISRRLIDDTAPGRRLAIARARRKYLANTGPDNALQIALDLVCESGERPLEQAFVREAVAASEVIVGAESRGRLQSERLADRVARHSPPDTSKYSALGVVGDGPEALDLAFALLATGAQVSLKVTDRVAARASVEAVRARLAWERENGRLSPARASSRARRLRGSSGFGGFGIVDAVAVIEEGSEDLSGRLGQIEQHVKKECTMILHGGSSPVGHAQEGLKNPERLIGVRIASPMSHFPLAELTPGMLTANATVSEARKLVQQLRLTGVVIQDGPTGALDRLLGVYFMEAAALVGEGFPIDTIDAAAEDAGFELGPFRRIDAMGIARTTELLGRILKFGSTGGEVPDLIARRSDTNAPFYRYRGSEAIAPAVDLDGDAEPKPTPDGDAGQAGERLILVTINEAARILEDGLVSDARDVDTIAIIGLGFPKDRGGPLFSAQESGIESIVARLKACKSERLVPAGLLSDLARSGGSLFRDGPSPSGQLPG